MESYRSQLPSDASALAQVLESELDEAVALHFTDPRGAARAVDEVARRAEDGGAGDPYLEGLASCARALAALHATRYDVVDAEGQAALERLPSQALRLRGLALQCLGRVAAMRGHLRSARGYFERGLEEARRGDSAQGEAIFLTQLCQMETLLGDLPAANAHAVKARAVHRRDGDRVGESMATFALGNVLVQGGAFVEGASVLQEAADLSRALDHRRLLGTRLAALASAQVDCGWTEAALANATEAEALLRTEADRRALAAALGVLSRIRGASGDVPGALAAAEEQQRLADDLQDLVLRSDGHTALAAAHLRAQDFAKAEASAREGLRLAEAAGSHWVATACRQHLAHAALGAGRVDEGIEWLEACLESAAPEDRTRRAMLHGELAEAYERKKDLAAALRALRQQGALLRESAEAEADLRRDHVEAVHRAERAEAAAAEAERRVSRALLEAQDEERRWVARELHDDLSQRLALLVVRLEALQAEVPEQLATLVDGMGGLAAAVREAASATHAVSRRLHPASLERLGLVSAVRSYLAELTEHHGLAVDFSAPEEPVRFPPEVELSCFRIVQEALQNVVRHSGVKEASLALHLGPRELRFVIEDPGCGFDLAASDGPGIGIVGMRERARSVGGSLSLQSSPGAGTRVDVGIPLPRGGE